MKLRLSAACLLFAIAAAGCGTSAVVDPSASPRTSAEESPGRPALATPPGLSEGEQPYTCGSDLTFSLEALSGEPGAETADRPAAEALRTLLAGLEPPEGGGPWFADRQGWRVVVLAEESAQFLLPATPDEGEQLWWSAEFHRAGSDWDYVRHGQCDVRPWFEGLGLAYWELAPGEQPGPESLTLRVLVTEYGCASGKSPEGRIATAAMSYLENSVTVILGVTPLTGPQTCNPGPPAEYIVELDEPLGDRQLLDGWVYPPEPRGGP